MTNKEKFIKVFNQEPDDTICPVYCSSNDKECPFYRGFTLMAVAKQVIGGMENIKRQKAREINERSGIYG